MGEEIEVRMPGVLHSWLTDSGVCQIKSGMNELEVAWREGFLAAVTSPTGRGFTARFSITSEAAEELVRELAEQADQERSKSVKDRSIRPEVLEATAEAIFCTTPSSW